MTQESDFRPRRSFLQKPVPLPSLCQSPKQSFSRFVESWICDAPDYQGKDVIIFDWLLCFESKSVQI